VVRTDPERRTALVIRDQEQFPLIFYRENYTDMAIPATASSATAGST
jgi:5-dehydro-2-deoxygluconokinase